MMNQTAKLTRQIGSTGPAAGKLVTRAKDAAGQDAERWLVRISFTQPIFGQGEHQWVFVGHGGHAEDVANAAMTRKPVRLAFPTNVVIIDGALIASVDFQPHEG